MDQTTRDAIVQQCKQEYDNGRKFKQGRVKDWHANEDLYYGRVKKAPKGRFNVPLPIMSGFIDTLLSKIDEPPALKFVNRKESSYKSAIKSQAYYEQVSTSEDADWASLDLDGKKTAAMYGRAIFKSYGESYKGFKFCHKMVDPYDFNIDPMGGGDLENHNYCSMDNIWKSKYDLKEGVKSKLYDAGAVFKMINFVPEQTTVDNDSVEKNKGNRFSAIGLSDQMYNFQGDGMIKFIEAGTTYHGERYYVLYNYDSATAIRVEKLKDMSESNLWPFTSWATNRDPHNFWSLGPADFVRPVAEVIKTLANQELDNRQKKNWGMRAYDPAMFPNAQELDFRPDGKIAVATGSSSVRPISSGIYQFETPELNGTINTVNWLDNMLGQKSGVTASAQGQAEETKVGIYYGNLQQVADRLGLYNKSYSRCHSAIGRRFLWACKEHLTKEVSVKIIGEKGIEWTTFDRNDVDPDFDIVVEGGNAQMQADEIKSKKQIDALAAIKADPNLSQVVNRQWIVEQTLRKAGFVDEEIRVALDTENSGNREILSEASEAIEQIIAGKTPALNRGANTAFQQKILDFAINNTDKDFALYKRLTDYSMAHEEIVQENMMRKALKTRAQMGMGLPGQEDPMNPGMGPAPEEPAPNSMGGTMSRVASLPVSEPATV